jgi:hypothetical protein
VAGAGLRSRPTEDVLRAGRVIVFAYSEVSRAERLREELYKGPKFFAAIRHLVDDKRVFVGQLPQELTAPAAWHRPCARNGRDVDGPQEDPAATRQGAIRERRAQCSLLGVLGEREVRALDVARTSVDATVDRHDRGGDRKLRVGPPAVQPARIGSFAEPCKLLMSDARVVHAGNIGQHSARTGLWVSRFAFGPRGESGRGRLRCCAAARLPSTGNHGVRANRMDEDWDEEPEWDDLPDWGLGPDDDGEDYIAATVGDVPTPGERLLYALGQLYLSWHRGHASIEPGDFDVEELARIIGVARDIELVTDSRFGRSFHFPSEVLLTDDSEAFPWRLLDLESWARLTDEHAGS